MKNNFVFRKQRMIRRSAVVTFVFIALSFSVEARAATTAKSAVKPKVIPKPAPIEIAGWIPYWRKATGTAEALLHIDALKEISPFGYTVKQDGTLFDAMQIDEEPWVSFIQAARAKKVKIIPTVMWSNTEAIDNVLRHQKLRKAHIAAIVKIVRDHQFDGIDIDYEGKKAETKKYFSLFLKELYQAIGKRYVVCTIEARTPLDSRYDTIPKNIQYANDYVAINKYCDRVRIMTYDQGSIDVKLNRLIEEPYVPVADPKWVEKVVRLATKTIAKKKIFIGVPTYGYEYEVKPLTYGYRYDLLWAFNPKYALDLAEQTRSVPKRNSAGEQSFMYSAAAFSALTEAVATDTTLSNNALIATTIFAQEGVATASSTPFRIVWWSDASAMKDKVALARKLGVRGIAIFKIDGGGDPLLWESLR